MHFITLPVFFWDRKTVEISKTVFSTGYYIGLGF